VQAHLRVAPDPRGALSALRGGNPLGHSSATTTLDHYAHVFDETRLAPMASMVDAIEAARAEVANGSVRPMFAEGANGVLRFAFEEN